MSWRRVENARPAVLVLLLLASISGALLARAWLAPPKGTAFVGTFAYVDDFYNYLSMVEQAQRGVLVFQSKMASPALPPALVNVEWLSVGWLTAALGGRAVLAYWLFGLIALTALVWVTDRWVIRCGVPPERRAAALLLVFTGGGLGGLCYSLGLLSGERAFDLRTGAYPFVEVLANPHFTAGTALLAAALAAFASGRALLGAALGALLALVRPYDAALLGAIETIAILVLAPARDWVRRVLPLLPLAPLLAYDDWVFRASPGFRVWVSPHYADTILSLGEWLVMLGPATVLALLARFPRREDRGPEVRPHELRLELWVVVALLTAALRPVAFSLQFLVGVGLPLLVLAAAGLARWRHAVELAVPLMAGSAVTLVAICLTPTPRTHPASENWRVARALAPVCRPGEVVLAPPEIGLLVGGLTPCWPFVSHAAALDYQDRLAEVVRFYDPVSRPSDRALLLDRACIKHVVLPADRAPEFLAGVPGFRETLTVTGGGGALSVWTRASSPGCAGTRP